MGAPRPNGSLGLTEGPPQPGGGAAAGPGDRGCENGALMDSFGIFLQGLLGVVAFSTLMREWSGGGPRPPGLAGAARPGSAGLGWAAAGRLGSGLVNGAVASPLCPEAARGERRAAPGSRPGRGGLMERGRGWCPVSWSGAVE